MKQLILLIAFVSVTMIVGAQEADENVIQNEYIIQFNKNDNSIGEFFEGHGELDMVQCLSRHMRIYLVRSNTDLIKKLTGDPDVKVIQHNHRGITRRALVPNDSLFNLQWNMLNTSTPVADISATQAWQMNHSPLTQMGDTIVVAVIDGGQGFGFDIYHPDINFFVNHHEIPNNGIDDDGNGYIDDYRGWNVFGPNDAVYDASDPHATHVSGIVGAKGNNTIGVAGVTWGVKILAVNGASNTESYIIMSYDYVMEMRRLYDLTAGAKGAFIVATNSSFGIDFGQASAHPIWCAMYDSMGALGILSATATANSAWSVDDVGDMPTTCPSRYLIAVTNTTSSGRLNSSAAYGPINIDIGAPGTNITSCFANDDYGAISGTSMASPHIAGAVAGLIANACPALLQEYLAHPDTIALLMRDYMLQSVDPLSSLHYKIASGGKLNLYHAFIAEESYNCNNCNYTASLTKQGLSCYGDSTAALSVSLNNAAYHHYLWSNGDTSASITGLAAGFYQVTVTDTLGCQRQLSAGIAAPQQIILDSVNVIPIVTGNPGNIIVNATAGSDTLSYALDSSSYGSSAIFAISTPGVHVVHIRNQSGCVIDTAIGIYSSGMTEQSAISSISLSPNPGSGMAMLRIKSNETFTADIAINDLTGRSLSEQTMLINSGMLNKQIDLSDLPDGMYLMSLSRAGNLIAKIKVLIIR